MQHVMSSPDISWCLRASVRSHSSRRSRTRAGELERDRFVLSAECNARNAGSTRDKRTAVQTNDTPFLQ